ncbi:MAG: hypothetical protein AAB726_00110 [Patescibacteria group bacterium]
MLNIAAISLYMMLSGVTGASGIPTPMALPEEPVQTVEQKKEVERLIEEIDVEAYVKEYFKDTPILAEISRCESHFRQEGKNGLTLRGMKDRDDLGAMQINQRYHGEQAKALGLDLHTLDGNLAYAKALYEKEGAYPWMASSACWSKVNELAMR